MALSHHSAHDKNLMRFILGSVGVHLFLLMVWLLASQHVSPKRNLDDLVVKTRLVKLGKKRDEKMLPRVAQKKPAAQKKKAPEPKKKPVSAEKIEKPPVVSDKKPAPQPVKPDDKSAPAEKKASTADILSQFTDENQEPESRPDLNALIQDVTDDDEGNSDGAKVGTEITGKLKADYNDKVKSLVRAKLTAPSTLTDQDRIRLKAVLAIRIGADGTLLSSSVTQSSGHMLFDNAALRAAKTAKFPPPPIAVRGFYASGISFNVCPVRCN